MKTARDKKIAENLRRLRSGAGKENLKDYIYEPNLSFLKNVALTARQ